MMRATAAELADFLAVHGLARPGESPRWPPLAGGVSSDIWRVDLPGRSLCVKQALRVARPSVVTCALKRLVPEVSDDTTLGGSALLTSPSQARAEGARKRPGPNGTR